jgi:hypothetical protein
MPHIKQNPLNTTQSSPQKTLAKYGAPTCLAAILLAYAGSDIMRLGVLLGAVGAYLIVKRRRVYPFARLLYGEAIGQSRPQPMAAGLDNCKEAIGSVATIWFAALFGVCVFSMAVPTVQISYFYGPDLFDRITHISAILLSLTSELAPEQKAAVAAHLVLAFRIVDNILLFCVSAFLSTTGSACLYWYVIYRRLGKVRQTTA